MSAGMRAYAEELAVRLPRVAPDLRFDVLPRTRALDWGEQVGLPRALRRLRPRMAHFLSVYAPLAAPRPYVVTVHDLIHLRFPQYFKRTVGPYYATVVRAVCARAARVITDDERTVDDLGRFLGVASAKVCVIPLGLNDAFRADFEPAQEPRPYFLFVGNHREHKDLATLFAAWRALDPELAVDLVLTGSDDLGSLRGPNRARGEVRFLGHVTAERLGSLYRGAVALVHPALGEGFGLPLLEAAAVGSPVIACADAVPAALRPYVDVFPPRDVPALARLMAEALAAPSPRAEARAYARSQTWDRCAERTAEVYRTVLWQTHVR
jgi:glycosyltransferase involved in cell wall biosynthesis